MPEWHLYYERVLIADGAPHRHVGDVFDYFALDFLSPKRLKKYRQKKKTAVPVVDHRYQVSAEVIHVSEDGCVINFGLLAAGRPGEIPQGCKEGDYVSVKIRINLPLCLWGVPKEILEVMRYKCRVSAIAADMTHSWPEQNPKPLNKKAPEIPYIVTESTDRVAARGYILTCSKVG